MPPTSALQRALCLLAVAWIALPAAANPPPRRGPHDSALRLASQLQTTADGVQRELTSLPTPESSHEKAAASGIRAFTTEAAQLPRHLTRWAIDPEPARRCLARLNHIAWEVHRSLDRSPRYRTVWSSWARVVSLLRSVNQAVDRLRG